MNTYAKKLVKWNLHDMLYRMVLLTGNVALTGMITLLDVELLLLLEGRGDLVRVLCKVKVGSCSIEESERSVMLALV